MAEVVMCFNCNDQALEPADGHPGRMRCPRCGLVWKQGVGDLWTDLDNTINLPPRA